jgi:hypothetical protein
MLVRVRSLVGAIITAVSCQVAASADIIFDNTSPGDHGITTTAFPQLGGEVTAAPGTARAVTEVDIGYTFQTSPGTADLQAFLYANDGTAGAPGTQLWQSSVMVGVSINSKNVLIAFSVPSVTVPDTFTWASAITNPSVVIGFEPATGATTGTFVQAWVGSPGSWNTLPPVFETEARIFSSLLQAAAPEPSTAVLLVVGLATVAAFKRFRHRPGSAR